MKNKNIQTRYKELARQEDTIWDGIEKNLTSNWTEIFIQKARDYADRIVITEVESGQSYTYKELDDASDNVANYIRAHISDKQIGLYENNSFAFVATLIGINKTGRLAILFNTREPLERIQALAKSTQTKHIFGQKLEGCYYHDITHTLHTPTQAPLHTHDLRTTLEDAAFVIFTSGTSGPSKPALFSHRRMIGAGVAWSLRTFMDEESCCYITLPLYHGNGLAVALSAVITAGARALLREHFSVTHFFDDVNTHHATHMVYIGELWRYLLGRYHDNPNQSLHTIFGNGLTKKLWEEVTKRYGIGHIVEHFGATEMPASALTNWYDVAGYCGYIPPDSQEAKEIIMIDEEGEEVPDGEVGEAIFRTPNNHYRGYLDATLDKAKILERDGDIWWRSGDLLRRNHEGFFTFVDRAGDSYRFKGENISSVDVETVLMRSGYCQEAVVYGIPFAHIDGKIGMASLLLKKPLDKGFYAYLKAHLAPYALPYFLRIQDKPHTTTSTLKIQKSHLAKEGILGYHDRSVFVLFEEKYHTMDQTIYDALIKQEIILGKQ